ncbi:MAG: YbgC/FadM family acyl-CoA thioesterase [Candidatus Aminicenantes bacterium]|nr:YbgC/FadM family acyl-CoA thioesterase [Candidatus Aminicenantes bacterium]
MMKSRSSEHFSNKTALNKGGKNFIELEELVRYSETDQMGVAHNKNYFGWFEIGRTEYCRQKNIPYKDIEAQGFYLVVVEAFCKYKKPLKYDQKFIIRVFLENITPKKVEFAYELVTKEEKNLISSGHTVHIVTDSEAKTCSLPPHIINGLKAS